MDETKISNQQSPLANSPVKGYGSAEAPSRVASVPAACVFILAVELVERLAFYTFTGTQEFFLVKTGYSLAQANGLTTAMATLCMAWAILAGWIADVKLGRFYTIIAFGLVYIAGALCATVAAVPSHMDSNLYLFALLVLVPLGTAGIKSNISNFGADQYDTSDPAQLRAQEQFFQWFYMSINIGSAFAYGFLTTLGTNGGPGVPQEYGYFAAYLIATCFMVAAVASFITVRSQYRMSALQESSAMCGVFEHVMKAVQRGSFEASVFCVGFVLAAASIVMSVTGAILQSQIGKDAAFNFSMATFACASLGVVAVIVSCECPNWLPDVELSTSLRAGDARGFLRLLPVIITSNLAFGALYNCMQYSYQQQACQMDLRIPFAGESQFAGSFFMIADCLGIAIATPLAVGWLNPALEKSLGNYFGHGGKFFLGMCVGATSVAMAAYLEIMRRLAPVSPMESHCAPAGVHMSEIGAVWMLVPFFLMGIGEIYTTPVMMHLAYSSSAPSTRTLAVVATLLVTAVSNAIFGVQVSALSVFMPNDLNEGHIEYGYYLSLVFAFVLYMAFVRSMRIFTPAVEA
eukprot:gb/GFBE01042060.1/.p1 GENE.gb/GFBE01042060.1/~~gb/GFBE01042060.1/.p1  ORF type:complete len:575 (+),score=115.28 gb/GFBE01042060.1/:1-1725(+)